MRDLGGLVAASWRFRDGSAASVRSPLHPRRLSGNDEGWSRARDPL